jgi:hypothetical protein
MMSRLNTVEYIGVLCSIAVLVLASVGLILVKVAH